MARIVKKSDMSEEEKDKWKSEYYSNNNVSSGSARIVKISDMSEEERSNWKAEYDKRYNNTSSNFRIVKKSDMSEQDRNRWQQEYNARYGKSTTSNKLTSPLDIVRNISSQFPRNTTKNISPINYVKNAENIIKEGKSVPLPINPLRLTRNIASKYASSGVDVNKFESDLESDMYKNIIHKNKRAMQKSKNWESYIDRRQNEMKNASEARKVKAEMEKVLLDEIEKRQNETKKYYPATVTKDENYNTSKNNTKFYNENINTLSAEESANLNASYKKGDMFKLSKGLIDDRSGEQKVIDNITAPAQNTLIGVTSVIPSTGKYMDGIYNYATKAALKDTLGKYTNSETAEAIGDVVGDKIYDEYGRGLAFTQDPNDSQKIRDEYVKYNEWAQNTIEENINKSTNPISKTLSELSPSIGQNLVPMAVSLAPIPGARVASTALFMTSAAGNYLEDAKERGMNDDEAITYATIMGALEGGSEAVVSGKMLSRVNKVFTGKELSDAFLDSLGVEITENFAQEFAIEPLSELTAEVVGGKDAANWDEVWERAFKSGFNGVLSALLLKGSSVGIASCSNAIGKIRNGESITELELKNIVADVKESGKINVKDVIKESFNSTVESLRNKYNNISKQLNNEGTRLQQINNMQVQDNNIRGSLLKANVANNQQSLYNTNGSESDVNGEIRQRGMLESNRSMARLYEDSMQQEEREYTRAEYERWEQSIKPIEENNITNEQKSIRDIFKRQYGKDIVFFDGNTNNDTYSGGASYIDINKINIDIRQAEKFGLNKMAYHELLESNIIHNKEIKLDIIEPAIQMIINDKNFEMQKNVFWENQKGNIPNDYLIAKDILCDRYSEIKTGENIDYTNMLSQETNMTIDFAIENFAKQLNSKNNTSNNNMTNASNLNENANISNINNNDTSIITSQDKMSQNQNMGQLSNMLNNKELPLQNYTYEKSNNVKIDNLRQDASKHFTNSEETHNYIKMLEKIIEDKDVEIRFDSNLKTKDGKVANGSYSNGVITINPNSTRAGEFIAIHELTHAIGTKSMRNIIDNYRKSNSEFDTAVKGLLENYNTTEITEEALSDVSAQLFGNQEFINNMAQNSPNIFQKIYSEIKYLWHQFRGYKNQSQFVEDLYYKWSQAYNSDRRLNETTNFSVGGIEGLKNISNIYEKNEGYERYREAIKMSKEKANNQEIFEKTGWFQDKITGKMKFNFSDKDMDIINRNYIIGKEYKLKDILKHDTLFEIYPQLKDYTVIIEDMNNKKKDKTIRGSYNRYSDIIKLDYRRFNNKLDVEGTLIHEIQHAIQKIEKFSRGTSKVWGEKFYKKSPGEIEARDTAQRLIEEKYNRKDLKSIMPQSGNIKLSVLDKMKNGLYNYLSNLKGGVDSNENLPKIQDKDTQNNIEDNRLVLGGINEKKEKGMGFSTIANSNNSIPPTRADVNTAKYSIQESENNSGSFNLPIDRKQQQLKIIEKSNPMQDDYHTGIRKVEDIKTLEETLKDSDWADYDEFNPDYTKQMAQEAIETGKITVYSSYPIEQGVFVSPSYMEAESYSADGKVYSKDVNTDDIAWIDPTQGQYAKIDNSIKYSRNNESWQSYLEKNFKTRGTTTNLRDIGLPLPERTMRDVGAPIDIQNNINNDRTGKVANNQEALYNSNESRGDINAYKERYKEHDRRRICGLLALYERGERNGTSSSEKFYGIKATEEVSERTVKKTLIDYANKYRKDNLTKRELYLSNIIKSLGGNVNFYEFGNNNYFQGLADGKTFYIDTLGDTSIENVFYHEIVHFLRQNSNKIYMQEIHPIVNEIASNFDYQEAIFNYANSSNEFDIRDFNINNQYKLAEEVVGDYVASLYGNLNANYGLEDSIIISIKNSMDKILNQAYNIQNKGQSTNIDILTEADYDVKGKKLTKKEIKKQLLQEMNITAEDLQVGKDITNINYQITDPIRVNEKVFGFKLGQKINDATINQTKHNTAEKTRWLNKERDEIRKLGIKARSKESAAVQKYGEKQYVDSKGNIHEYGDLELKKEFPNIQTQLKIKKASEILRNKYDVYLEQINSVITALGYDEIPKRKDYMRHFQELGDTFSKTGIPFNLNDMKAEDLPTDINGLTELNKPGKNWFAQAQVRYGNKTTYDAITGIDGYLEGAGNLIYHTKDIQNYRALSSLIRDTFGKTKGFESLEGLTDKQIQQRIEDIQNNKLSRYAAWLDEQANNLAGKKGAIDRGTERIIGRRAYTFMNTLKSQVGSNMTGFNVRSSLTNFISTTIAAAKTNKVALVKGTVSTINNMFHNDGFIDKSDFLTTRFGSDALSQKIWQKVSNAGQVFMSGSDYFTSNIIARSKYFEGLQKGMTESQALQYSNDFSSRVMGDRSQGATAELFNSKTLGLFTQFQLEVNNQLQYMGHDVKMDYQKMANTEGKLKASASVVFQLGQIAAYSYFFNELFEALTGSRAAFDPIEIIKVLFGIDDDEEDKKLDERVSEAMGLLVDNIPFGNLFTGGGRIPVSEAINGVGTLIKKVTNQKNDYGGDISWEDVGKDLLESAPYWFLPTGYGQIRKTTQGLNTVINDGDYNINSKGEKELKFPIENKNAGDYIKAGLFGKYALPMSKEYVNRDYKKLSANQTKTYEDAKLPYKEYLEYLDEKLENTEDKIQYISSKQYSTEQKWGLYKNDIFSNTKRKDGTSQLSDIEYIVSNGVSKQDFIDMYNEMQKYNIDIPNKNEYKEMQDNGIKLKKYVDYKVEERKQTKRKQRTGELKENQQLKSSDKIQILIEGSYSEKEKMAIYENYIISSNDNEFKFIKASNMKIEEYLKYKQQDFKSDKTDDGTLNGKTVSKSKQKKVETYLNSMKISGDQRLLLYAMQGYGITSSQKNQLANYVNKQLNLKPKEKLELFDRFSGFTVYKNGEVEW